MKDEPASARLRISASRADQRALPTSPAPPPRGPHPVINNQRWVGAVSFTRFRSLTRYARPYGSIVSTGRIPRGFTAQTTEYARHARRLGGKTCSKEKEIIRSEFGFYSVFSWSIDRPLGDQLFQSDSALGIHASLTFGLLFFCACWE